MKKALTLIVALILCVSLAAPALAEETSGTCGENLTWSYSDGTLTISGTGDMGPFPTGDMGSIGSKPWNSYKDDIVNVVIEDGVTNIGYTAFYGYSNLTSVTIPASVTIIMGMAFDHCDNLTDVYYGGNESQWEQMQGSIRLSLKTIHYAGDAAPEPGDGNDDPSTGSDPSTESAPSTGDGISVTVNGSAVAWTDAEPFIDANSRTMVPLRAVADAMGLDVNWDPDAREAGFTGSGKTICFPIDSTTARTSDGETVEMDTAAVIAGERTYAPIRYLAEYFGYTVDWDAAARTVIIAG